MSRSVDKEWGEDRLGEDVLEPQHYLPIEDIVAGEYDFLLIDERERRCMLRDYQIFASGELEIDDKWLRLHCKSR